MKVYLCSLHYEQRFFMGYFLIICWLQLYDIETLDMTIHGGRNYLIKRPIKYII